MHKYKFINYNFSQFCYMVASTSRVPSDLQDTTKTIIIKHGFNIPNSADDTFYLHEHTKKERDAEN